MEVISRVIKIQLPNYLRSLPIPSTFGGFLKLSGSEWVQLVPFVVTTSVVVYLVISALVPSKPKKEEEWVNKTHQKEKEKVADAFQIEDLGDKSVFCRCWKSKKFPRCDGSHTQHNKETGDNVGPVVLKRKKPAAAAAPST
ncbi:CDGSH iron-sulfur domain-containing protein 2 homolog A-like isoform X1 [Orbicella faveolata]|uniref:CDGSH iron-sulfur domain-containing protein 2 homolog A-like isoform X1 n=1 Tax=Orbicella faveolata TaxID=48498 RepID=UPI0009E23C32|nr:CDGSH iron-sulfur domain-containing protein 2 homolog A-like isoform X1 [Orbicella faveolata]